jgi:hypothetical protein
VRITVVEHRVSLEHSYRPNTVALEAERSRALIEVQGLRKMRLLIDGHSNR